MIKLEAIKGKAHILRFYEEGAFEISDRPPFVASCLIEQDCTDEKVIWIKNFQGVFNRKILRELVATLLGTGATVAKAYRVDGHILPFSTINEKGEYVMTAEEALKRLKL